MPDPATLALRRLALAVSLTYDIDLTPAADGVVLAGCPEVRLSWCQVRRAALPASLDTCVEPAAVEPAAVRRRVADQLQALRAALALLDAPGGRPLDAPSFSGRLLDALRPLGLLVGAPDHPGATWVRAGVPGGALDLGLALPAPCTGSASVVPGGRWLPVTPWVLDVLDAAAPAGPGNVPGLGACWAAAQAYLERMGTLAAARLGSAHAALRPMGDCDVVTLLGSRALRAALAGEDGTGLRGVAVPMRRRGWVDLSGIDPAFVIAAAAATGPGERGFDGPLLVTAEELTLARVAQRPGSVALRDPAVPGPQWPGPARR